MFRIKHKDDKEKRCAYDRCNRKLRDFGFIEETTGSIYCTDICAMQDLTEKEPRLPCLQ